MNGETAMESERHTYESSLPEFLDWATWVYENCTQEEIQCFFENTTPVLPEKNALYERWLTDQKIIKHTVMQGDTIIFERTYP
jgi:hypothetical protein